MLYAAAFVGPRRRGVRNSSRAACSAVDFADVGYGTCAPIDLRTTAASGTIAIDRGSRGYATATLASTFNAVANRSASCVLTTSYSVGLAFAA